jgi:hypothetical protein
MKETDPAATEASQGYPDKAALTVTLAKLKAAPDFQYARSPLAEADRQPAGSSEPMKKTTPRSNFPRRGTNKRSTLRPAYGRSGAVALAPTPVLPEAMF